MPDNMMRTARFHEYGPPENLVIEEVPRPEPQAGEVLVRSLGAQTVVDYTATPFESVVRDVDVVLDTLGGATQERSWQVLKPGGILVAIAGPASEETARRHGVRTSAPGAVHGQPTTGLLRRIADLIESGAVV